MPNSLNHIVLVDDNETTSFLNNRLLGRLAVAEQVTTYTRADEAFAKLWADGAPAPDLVFVDLKMPGVSGFEFLKMYSKLPQPVQNKTVLAVLTTSMHQADTARVAEYPNVEYLTKPLTEEKMQKLLDKRFQRD
ncbi:MAG: response regulator [Janthinobacterium lividum]